MAVEHLLHGHRRIACLTPATAAGTSGGTRYRAYSDALAAANIQERDDYVGLFDGTSAGAYAAATRLLSLPDRPTAIYATTDYAAVSAINAASAWASPWAPTWTSSVWATPWRANGCHRH